MLTEAGHTDASTSPDLPQPAAPGPPGAAGPDAQAAPASSAADPPRRFRENFRIAGSGASSFVLHAILLCLFALLPSPDAGIRAFQEIKSWMVEELDEPALTQAPVVNLNEISDTPLDELISAEQLAVAPIRALDAQLEAAIETIDTDQADLEIPPIENMTGVELDAVMLQQGVAGEQATSVEGAVDLITREISRHLEQNDVLVVWLMDSSISLAEDRQSVADRLRRVYDEIEQLGVVRDEALLGAVVAYGREDQVLQHPTASGDEVVDAIRQVPTDPSGEENVFSAIVDTAHRYRSHRTRDDRHMMFIVWTDESGTDTGRLEDAVNACRRLAISVYTVGPSSMFGKQKGTQRHFVEELGEFADLEVDRGPDAFRRELLQIPYWFRGNQLTNLRSGLGPFALTRLARESGGAYFVNDRPDDRAPFDLELMRRYMPSYFSPNEYQQSVRKSRLRTATLQAVDLVNQRRLKDAPPFFFAPTGDNFQDQLKEAQEKVAFNLLTLEHALSDFGEKGLEPFYLQETSPRWRAWYDLTFGRLLAMYVRCTEYNVACAELRGKGAAFVNEKSNRWRFRPDEEIRANTRIQQKAEQARLLLERCARDHEGTPWAVLAQREIKDPLGFTIDEAYVKPPPPPNMNRAGNPNIPRGRREEQLRMLNRERQKKLPKL